MSFITWTVLAGALLLMLGLSSAYLKRLPISTASIYLVLGVGLGPVGLSVLTIDPLRDARWLEHLTEVAVVISLFVSGLKLRLRWSDKRWRVALRLAGPLMLISIVGVALFAHWVLGLELGLSMLLGAVLAPTDPVLASALSVNNASDKDRVRHALTAEAGFNDGMAFPFLVLALQWLDHGALGAWLGEWAVHRLLWAVPAGLCLGYALGKGTGHLAIKLRARHGDTTAPNDFLTLALIALAYAGAELIGAWGFLAVFAAGVGLRRAEWEIVEAIPHPSSSAHSGALHHPPAEERVVAQPSASELKEPAVAAGLLVAHATLFGDTIERLLEVLLVVIVGACLVSNWDVRAISIAVLLMVVLRPLAAHVVLIGTPTTRAQRTLMGWFGIRGIGSIYYLCYALNHGVSGSAAQSACAVTISIIAMSVFVHGVTAQPAVAHYERSLQSGR